MKSNYTNSRDGTPPGYTARKASLGKALASDVIRYSRNSDELGDRRSLLVAAIIKPAERRFIRRESRQGHDRTLYLKLVSDGGLREGAGVARESG